ncbi:hypothetical protein DPMN_155655 [Dreissena polymorpha]|uniref:Uncharacterized protein n=1 Tax=Dreissena polymorpha TaxID=45954 RepID=A0A9D4FQS0_DREPO|nr:hypothetical protein DPMN_155655 [Dreissena polymorpha]
MLQISMYMYNISGYTRLNARVMDTGSLLYYLMLIPSTLIVFVICLFLRWMGLKFFRHN